MEKIKALALEILKISNTAAHLDENYWAVFSFIGGGGKTTTIKGIAKALADLGVDVVLTTTTKVLPVDDEDFSTICLEDDSPIISFSKIPVVGRSITKEGKLDGWTKDEFPKISKLIKESSHRGIILVEADGTMSRSLKGYKESEPQIPQDTLHVFVLMGLDALGKPFDHEHVHRVEILSQRLDKAQGSVIEPGTYIDVLESVGGYMDKVREQSPGADFSVILTRRRGYDRELAKELIALLKPKFKVCVL